MTHEQRRTLKEALSQKLLERLTEEIERDRRLAATRARKEYREKNKVPCEDCGTRVEGKGRSKRGGAERPFLCIHCCHQRRRKVAA